MITLPGRQTLYTFRGESSQYPGDILSSPESMITLPGRLSLHFLGREYFLPKGEPILPQRGFSLPWGEAIFSSPRRVSLPEENFLNPQGSVFSLPPGEYNHPPMKTLYSSPKRLFFFSPRRIFSLYRGEYDHSPWESLYSSQERLFSLPWGESFSSQRRIFSIPWGKYSFFSGESVITL